MTLTIFPLYEITEDSVIPKGTIKLSVTIGEPPQMMTIMTSFLIVNCPSAFNRVLDRLLLKVLKVVTSIHCLTIKFSTPTKTGQV